MSGRAIETSQLDVLLETQRQMQEELSARIDQIAAASAPWFLDTIVALAMAALEPQTLMAAVSAPSEELHFLPELRGPGIVSTIATNRGILQALEWLARRHARPGNEELVLRLAEAAGHWACFHHTGTFASFEIERSLVTVGKLLIETIAPEPIDRDPCTVLHVMSVAPPIGGHVRLVERWIRNDTGRRHAIVLTEQGDVPVPEVLLELTDGNVRQLQSSTRSERVSELFRWMEPFGRVALHLHPYDAVAVAACAVPERRPRTIFVDHGDHLFWLGTSATDVLASLRPSGARIATDRRGIARGRLGVLPIPLDSIETGLSRDQAKRALGIDTKHLVMVTMASVPKYSPIGDLDFPSLVGQVLDRVPSSLLLAIGPPNGSPTWSEITSRFPERIQLLGPTPDPSTVLTAADLYLDSFPFSSATALLEAALHHVPSVSMQPGDYGPMFADFPSVTLHSYTTPTEWVDGVVSLLDDGGQRTRIADRIESEVRGSHLPEAWRADLGELYEINPPDPINIPPGDAAVIFSGFDRLLAAYLSATGTGRSAMSLLIEYELLPAALG